MNDSTQSNDQEMHRSLAAIVITDVVNYSGMMSVNEHLTLRLVQRDMDFLTKQCNRFEGEVLKSTGDGLLMTFDSAVNAVSCALSIQRGFAQAASKIPPKHRLQHRIGIHLGDVYLGNNDAMGDGVNVAARLQEKSEPGGVCVSQTVYDVVKNRIGIQAVFLGPTELKNIREAVPIYQLLLDAASGEAKIASGTKFPGGRIGMAVAGIGLVAVIITFIFLVWPRDSQDESARDPFGGSRSEIGRHRTQHPSENQNWINLMPVLDPEKDGHGRWELKPEGLVGFPGAQRDNSPVKMCLPAETHGSYEIEILFESREEATVGLVLCVGDRMIAALVGGPDGKGGLHEMHNDPFTGNETTCENTRLEPDREHCLHALVKLHPKDKATVAISLDGRMVIDWTGPMEALTMPDEWRFKRSSSPGIGIDRTGVLFRQIRIRGAGGEIKILGESSRMPPRRFPAFPRGRGGRRRTIIDKLRPGSEER